MGKVKSQHTDAASTESRKKARAMAADLYREFVKRGRLDGWRNAVTLLGNISRDKRLSTDFTTERVMDLYAEDVYRGDDMFSRIVDTVPEEISRAGWELLVQPPSNGGGKSKKDATAAIFEGGEDDGKEISEEMSDFLSGLGDVDVVEFAMKTERAKGGAAIFPVITDGVRDLSIPLNLDRVQSLDALEVLEPLELIPYQWYSDPMRPKYGQPQLYWMQRTPVGNMSSGVRIPIHESRLIKFPGIVISRRQLQEHWGWGDSMLVRIKEILSDFQQAFQSMGVLLEDFAQAVFSVDGLSAAFSAGKDDLLVRRAQNMDMARSVVRGIIIDTKEKFERQTTNVAGLADLLDRQALRLAAAARMPVTILMGQAPAGLNATGASDVRAFYDVTAASRPRKVLPRIRRYTEIAFRAKQGPTRGREPKRWSYQFGSMWQMTDAETAALRKTVAETDAIYIDKGVLLPEEVAKSRMGGDKWSMETVLDKDLREAFDEEADAAAQQEADMLRQQVAAAANAPKDPQADPEKTDPKTKPAKAKPKKQPAEEA